MNVVPKIKNYFTGVISEAKKVIWPGRKKVINHTLIVIWVVIIVMIVFGSLDYGLSKLLEYIIKQTG